MLSGGVVMLKTKSGKSILSCRWGRPRGKSCIVRISVSSRRIIDRLPDIYRRDFVDAAINAASRSPMYESAVHGGYACFA